MVEINSDLKLQNSSNLAELYLDKANGKDTSSDSTEKTSNIIIFDNDTTTGNVDTYKDTSVDKTDSTDFADDGKIKFEEKAKSFLKGLVSPITSMFSSPANFLKGVGMAAGCAALCWITGGAAAPLLVAGGLVGGGIQLVKGIDKASSATTDAEAKEAWENIGAGSGIVAASVIGAKSALKGAATSEAEIAEINNMGHIKAAIKCVADTPEAVSNSISNIGAKFSGITSGSAFKGFSRKGKAGSSAQGSQTSSTTGTTEPTGSQTAPTTGTTKPTGGQTTSSAGAQGVKRPYEAPEIEIIEKQPTTAKTQTSGTTTAAQGGKKAYQTPEIEITPKQPAKPQYNFEEIWSSTERAKTAEVANQFTSAGKVQKALPEHATTSGIQTEPVSLKRAYTEAPVNELPSDGSIIELGPKVEAQTTSAENVFDSIKLDKDIILKESQKPTINAEQTNVSDNYILAEKFQNAAKTQKALPEHATTNGVQTEPVIKAASQKQIEAQARLNKAINGEPADGSVIELTEKAEGLTAKEEFISEGAKITKRAPNKYNNKTYQKKLTQQKTINDAADTYFAEHKNTYAEAKQQAYDEYIQNWIKENQADIDAANAVADGPLETAPRKSLFSRIKDKISERRASRAQNQAKENFLNDTVTVDDFKANGGTFENGRAIQNGKEYTGTITKNKSNGNVVKIEYSKGKLVNSQEVNPDFELLQSKNYSLKDYGTGKINIKDHMTNKENNVTIIKWNGKGYKNTTIIKDNGKSWQPVKETSVKHNINQGDGSLSLAQINKQRTFYKDDSRVIRSIDTQYGEGGIKTSQTREFSFIKYNKEGIANNISESKINKSFNPDGTLKARVRS